jgi:hypothetical protein
MQFAIVEVEPGLHHPVVLTGVSGDRLTGRHLTGDIVSFPISSVVHVGLTGGEPNIVYQYCPTWVVAAMRASGVQGRIHRIAANPKFADPGHVKYQTGEQIWNYESRKRRATERALFASLMKKPGGLWSGYEVGHEFGYDQIKEFIYENREKQSPDTLLWCMIFAGLTANEGTQDAERNLSGFSAYLRELFARGVAPRRGLISLEDFTRAWKSGLARRKFEDFNHLLDGYEKLIPALAYAKDNGLRGTGLRRYIATTVGIPSGLGITKFSFALECWGENVACLDRWMFRALGADEKIGGRYTAPGVPGPKTILAATNKKIAAHRKAGPKEQRAEMTPIKPPPWPGFSEGSYVLAEYGGKRFSARFSAPPTRWQVREDGKWKDYPLGEGGQLVEPVEYPERRLKVPTEEALKKHGTKRPEVLTEYEWWEKKLTRTVYYQIALSEAEKDPRAALNPLARAQWTMWEDILRRHPDPTIQLDKARHMPLWIAIHGDENVIKRALIPYHEHFEEVARKHRELLERTVARRGPRREEAIAALPGAVEAHEMAKANLEAARAAKSKRPGIGKIFSEALSWKRGEVGRASKEAKQLALKLSERALQELASA